MLRPKPLKSLSALMVLVRRGVRPYAPTGRVQSHVYSHSERGPSKRWPLLPIALMLMAASLACSNGSAPALPEEEPADPGSPVRSADDDVPGTRLLDLGRDHLIEVDEEHPPYNSVPATSGWHYGFPLAPAPWGVYDAVLPNQVLVHNLEHGGVGVHYDCPEGCEQLVAELTRVVEAAIEQGKKVVMSPYPAMSSTIALTAWTYFDGFDEFDDERTRRFISAHESSPVAPEYNVR